MPTRSSRQRIRRTIGLITIIAVVAALAQLAGVGGPRGGSDGAKAKPGTTLATLAGAPVPDIGSTKLGSTTIKAKAGETVKLRASAKLLAQSLPSSSAGQVVCGIEYSRDGDAAWTLGTPYDTVSLAKTGSRANVSIDRSFEAPAADTYRAAVRCHVSAPASKAKVTSNGAITSSLGLPQGAARPA